METKRERNGTEGIQKEIGASRSMSSQVYLGLVFDCFSLVFQAFFDLGGLKVAKTFQDAPKTRQDAPKTPPRRGKTFPKCLKTPQDAPRGAQEPPKTHQNPFKIHTYVENLENQKNLEKPKENQ